MGATRTDGEERAGTERWPWELPSAPRLAFVVLRATGPDTAVDRLLGIRALRVGADGAGGELELELELDSEPGPGAPADGDGGGACAAWGRLEELASGAVLVVESLEGFAEWARHLGAGRAARRAVVALDEVAALLLPGRPEPRGAEPSGPAVPGASAGLSPPGLRRALAELLARFLGLGPDALAAAAVGYAAAWSRLATTEEAAAERLALALALAERPSRLGALAGTGPRPALADGQLSAAVEGCASLADGLASLEPRWTRELGRWEVHAPVATDHEGPLPFPGADLALLDDALLRHVPALFAGEHAAAEAPPPRASQHAVAREVARSFGRAGSDGGELLLVHAPTGTGKTLAYLVPALLWARRHGVRVAVATYTRALQEQAMDREVPRALAALERAGAEPGLRVSVLKGRDNYLCWRSLELHVPSEESGAEELLAWTNLTLFALTDAAGDMDRLPRKPPLALESTRAWREAVLQLHRQVRAESGCCTRSDDRRTCAAEVARRRAERSHVVLTNHSFALSRRDFFRHIVFDECEHLHDQAHAAWSHTLRLRAVEGLFGRLARPGAPRSRALLDRLERAVPGGTPTHQAIEHCIDALVQLDGSLLSLQGELARFLAWRRAALGERKDRDGHSLLREYAEGEPGADLVADRQRFARRGHELERALCQLAERLEASKLPRLGRLRRALDLARTDLLETLAAVEAWIPLVDGRVAFGAERFHDVETDPAGGLVLAARVLLPNEFLGRYYLPELATGIFLSATTWLAGGFEAAKGYLGLDRAEQPAEDEERPGRAVRAYRAPEVFDYGRVLVAVPRDAPEPGRDKEAALDYARRFIGYLAERTRGRILALFTNAEDVRRVGKALEGFFRARRIPFWYQNMPGTQKEELAELFRRRVDSVLLGVDTFWYGADFPGETLEHLVIARLPYGVPDHYHHAQCAVLGTGEQRRRIYMPRALAKFRQGFGRLMRRESDRGCIYLLDPRVLDPRHRPFLRELPLEVAGGLEPSAGARGGARLVRGDTDRCIAEALRHVGLSEAVARAGLGAPFRRSEPGREREHGPVEPSSGDISF